MHDVAIIGAGPAGSITARLLAERGHDVIVLEEHRDPGLPVHCTGLLGLESFDEFDLPRETIRGIASSARFWGAAGTFVVMQSDRVQAAVIDRAALDQTLARRAVDAGAELRRGWRADRVEIAGGKVVIAGGGANQQSVESRVVVLACGAQYRFHRQIGLDAPQEYLQTAQLETRFPERPHLDVRFGRQVAPNGFAWLVPFRRGDESYARIGLMSETRGRERFDAFARMLWAEHGLSPTQLDPPRLKMLPLAPISKTYSTRVIAVGDAAGLVKPTTGGGIYYGLLSGRIAAGVLDTALRKDRLGESELKNYQLAWRKRLGAEIRMGLAFRHLAERLDDSTIDSLIDLARVNGVVPLLQETASFNWHRKAAAALLSHEAFRKIILRSLSV